MNIKIEIQNLNDRIGIFHFNKKNHKNRDEKIEAL